MGCVHSSQEDVFPAEPPTPHTLPLVTGATFGYFDHRPEGGLQKPVASTSEPLRSASSEGSSIVSGAGTADRGLFAGRKGHSLPSAANLFVRSSSSTTAAVLRPISVGGSPCKDSLTSSGLQPARADAEVQTDALRLEVREMGPTMPVRWKKGESIGSGSFGTVYLGLNSETGELLAVKEVAVLDGGRSTEAVEQLEREVNLLSSLNHPNIVRYVGTVRDGNSLFIFLEYVPGGSIASLLSRFGPLEEQVIRIYTRQLLSGLAYLHAQRTVHRDVKGANLLVEKNGRIKLADFGMAKQMVEQVSFTKSFKGSAFWMAPEVIKQQGHGIAADIWSIGCTVLEMATGKPPWAQCSTQVQAIFKIASSNELPAIPETLSPEASEFILLCLQRDPSARPSAEELLRHPFVSMCADDVPALAGPTVDFVAVGRGASQGSYFNNLDTPDIPGSLNSSLVHSRFDMPRRCTKTESGVLAGVGLGNKSGGSLAVGLAPGGQGPQISEEDVSERLAALVLGNSLHLGKYKNRGDLNSSLKDSGNKGLLNSSLRGSASGLSGLSSNLREGGGAAGCKDDDDEGIDFTTQPQQFKVRGLLSLPPLRMLQGQQLPIIRLQSLASAGSSPLQF